MPSFEALLVHLPFAPSLRGARSHAALHPAGALSPAQSSQVRRRAQKRTAIMRKRAKVGSITRSAPARSADTTARETCWSPAERCVRVLRFGGPRDVCACMCPCRLDKMVVHERSRPSRLATNACRTRSSIFGSRRMASGPARSMATPVPSGRLTSHASWSLIVWEDVWGGREVGGARFGHN